VNVVRVREVTKRYGAVTAVADLDFEVEAGETFALVGPNGAGKTTTLKLLLGLVRPDRGAIAIGAEGLAPAEPRARRDIGYVPQRVEFPAGRTVAEVLEFFAALRGAPRVAVARALERVGLEPVAARRASELSGGYIQRLSLAQALLGDPALLVLDEPTASLDPEATFEFRSLLEQLRREGRTILLCSHLLAEVERVADRVLILVGGRSAALERLDHLRERQVKATSLRLEPEEVGHAARVLADRGIAWRADGDRALALDPVDGRGLEALAALREAGVALRGFELQRPSLEEIFMAVVKGGRRES
jgi:Cu-processing system ATP-binding protein